MSRIFAGLLCSLAAIATFAGDCRLAFDMGSSGIRAGSTLDAKEHRSQHDYLATWWKERSLSSAMPPTVAALVMLQRESGVPSDCEKVGGGFSAWRLAAESNPAELAELLTRIRIETGVSVLVVPQRQEGAYGFLGARQVLGARLTTTHVLDIGGGSLQVAGAQEGVGATLGQKAWHRRLCVALRKTEDSPCLLQPMSAEELARARRLLAGELKPLVASLSGPVSLTAISRPVTRGVAPAVRQRFPAENSGNVLSLDAVQRAIDELAVEAFPGKTSHAAYLLSDLLLVEGLLLATGGQRLQVAEADINNLPGLLADDHAFRWGRHHACYLDRLRSEGYRAAFESDPITCAASSPN